MTGQRDTPLAPPADDPIRLARMDRIAQIIDGPRPPRSPAVPPRGPPPPDKPPPPKPPGPGVAPIEIIEGEEARMVAEAENALSADPAVIFQRGKYIVRPGIAKVKFADKNAGAAAALHMQSRASIYGALTERTRWVKYDSRAKTKRPCRPPCVVSEIIAGRAGQWNLPVIVGVISCPTLRPDGSILERPGYDDDTGLFCQWNGADLGLSQAPSRRDAEEALDDLLYLLREFKFADEKLDLAVALSALMSPVARGAMGACPMHAVTAPAPGSGKSFLVDLASMIATGTQCPVQSVSGDPQETEKRIGGAILAGLHLVSFDNVNGELKSDLLCQAIERPLVQVRPLGTSDQTTVENRASFYATGNGLHLGGDMVRRALVCRLDTKLESPETRLFENDPLAMVAADRRRYVRAVLTIVLAFLASGESVESLNLPPFASFDGWSRTVRGALRWLGCTDPAESIKESKKVDSDTRNLQSVIAVIREAFGPSPFSIADVTGLFTERKSRHETADELEARQSEDDRARAAREERETLEAEAEAKNRAELREIFINIAGARGNVDSKRLTWWFKRHLNRMSGHFRIEEAEPDSVRETLRFKIATV